MIQLDYSIQSIEERKKLVDQILSDPQNKISLDTLSDYLLTASPNILTQNRMATINKRECSFEGLAENFLNGEDGLQKLINQDTKALLQPKIAITEKDTKQIPYLPQVKDAITTWEKILPSKKGREAYIAKQAIIELHKEQYNIKMGYTKPITATKITKTHKSISLEDTSYIDEKGNIIIQGISLMEPNVILAILNNYSSLCDENVDNFSDDIYYLIQEFNELKQEVFKNNSIYTVIFEEKIKGKTNKEISQLLQKKFNKTHTAEYISCLWRKKMPKLLATKAKEKFLLWAYPYKKICSKCGKPLPAHNLFFSKNNSSKDGFYSICKDCRNSKERDDE